MKTALTLKLTSCIQAILFFLFTMFLVELKAEGERLGMITEEEELSMIVPPSIECTCPKDSVILTDLLVKAAANTPDGYDSLLFSPNTSFQVTKQMGPPCAEFQIDPDSLVCAGTCKYSVRFVGKIRKKLQSGSWSRPVKYIYPTPSHYTPQGYYVVSDSIWTYPCGDWRGISSTVNVKGAKKRKLEKGASRMYMNVYPNPINSGNAISVRLFSDQSDKVYLHIYDVNGKESIAHAMTINVKEGVNNAQLDLSGLKPGIYSLVSYMSTSNVMRKELLIIQ